MYKVLPLGYSTLCQMMSPFYLIKVKSRMEPNLAKKVGGPTLRFVFWPKRGEWSSCSLNIRSIRKSASFCCNFYIWEKSKATRCFIWQVRRMVQRCDSFFFNQEKEWMVTGSCAEKLSWWRNHFLSQSSRRFLRTATRSFVSTSN